jgi:hypothetical protein
MTTATRDSKVRNIVSNILIFLPSVALLASSITKFAHIPAIVAQMAALGFTGPKLMIVAVLELASSVLFLLPKTRALWIAFSFSIPGRSHRCAAWRWSALCAPRGPSRLDLDRHVAEEIRHDYVAHVPCRRCCSSLSEDLMTDQTLPPTSAGDFPTPHEASHGRSRRWLRIGVVLAIVAVVVFVAVRRRTATQTSARAKVAAESKPVASVIALGSIVPGNSVIHLNAPASSGEAMLQSLFVRQNERVTKNQIVGTLDSIGRLKAAVSVARAQVAQEQAAYDKVVAGNSAFQIAAQRATVERLRAEAQRQASDVERY